MKTDVKFLNFGVKKESPAEKNTYFRNSKKQRKKMFTFNLFYFFFVSEISGNALKH